MTSPSPAPLTEAEAAAIEKAAAKAAGEGLTPAELAVATAMADRQNRAELAAGYGAAAMPGDFADEARAVVAAVQEPIEQQLGRDLMEDGLESVLYRLIGEKHMVVVLNIVRAEAVEDAARKVFGTTLTAHGAIRQDLYDHAKSIRATPLPGSPLAEAASLSLPASKESQK